jgi:hypothetical protein
MVGTSADPRAAGCPGGPETNLRALTHRISEKRIADALHWSDPFTAPLA